MLSGKLPDGTGFSVASNILADGTSVYLLIFSDQNVYNRKGVFTTFFEVLPTSLTGFSTWQKPVTKGPYLPIAINADVSVAGYPYSKAIADTLTSGTMELLEGMLPVSGTAAGFTVTDKHFVFTPPNPLNVKLSINSATAAVRGSFDFPGTHSKVKLNGLVLEDGTTAVAIGYFHSPVISGNAALGVFEALP